MVSVHPPVPPGCMADQRGVSGGPGARTEVTPLTIMGLGYDGYVKITAPAVVTADHRGERERERAGPQAAGPTPHTTPLPSPPPARGVGRVGVG